MRQKSLQADGLKHSAPIQSGCRLAPRGGHRIQIDALAVAGD
jgi:hypothetical protein